MEIAHHLGVGMRACHGADYVEGIVHIGDPIPHGLVQGVLESAGTRTDRHHLGTQQFHTEDVRLLPLHINLAHIDGTGQAE